MATGDASDFNNRLIRLLPSGWFPDVAPRLNAVLQGFASAFAGVYMMLAYTKAQMRVSTASGSFLDLAAQDYFGVGGLSRLQYEGDPAYSARIKYNLTAPRGTRAGMIAMLTELTGTAPVIFQPNRPTDTGGLATPSNYAIGGGIFALGGTGAPGLIGTLTMPGQVFITVTRPVTGYNIYGGYSGLATPTNAAAGGGDGAGTSSNYAAGGGSMVMIDPASVPGRMTDAFIYQQIANWMPAGFVAWVHLH